MDTTIPITTTTGTSTERPVRTYLGRLNRLLLSPSIFFRDDLPGFSLSQVLTFGIVSAWLASAIAFAVDTMNSLLLARLFENWVQRLMASEEGFSILGLSADSFVWAAGLLILAPFIFLIRIFFGTITLYLFSRLLVEESPSAPEPVTFSGAMRIQAASFGGHWFSVVPFFGTLIAFVARLILLVTGVRERFQVSTGRAMLVVLAPYFFLLLGLFLLLILLVLAFMQLPFRELLEFDPRQFGL
jgi:hypothetical protein